MWKQVRTRSKEKFVRRSHGKAYRRLFFSFVLMVVWCGVAHSQIMNGSFESGYAGWTLSEAVYNPQAGIPFDPTGGTWGLGANGTVIDMANPVAFDYHDNISVTQTAFSGLPVTWAATDGGVVAFHLQNQSGHQKMFQDVTLAPNATELTWDMSYRDHLGMFDPMWGENFDENFVAVNLRRPSDNGLIATLFRTAPGDPSGIPEMTSFTADIAAFAGQHVRLEVELKNLGAINLAVDNFRIFPIPDGGGGDPPPPPSGQDITIWVRDAINPRSNGVVAVAILGTADFDPTTTIDVATLASGDAYPVHGGHVEDVNGDGHMDLLVHLEVRKLDLGGGLQTFGAGTGGSELCLDAPIPACAPVQLVGGGR